MSKAIKIIPDFYIDPYQIVGLYAEKQGHEYKVHIWLHEQPRILLAGLSWYKKDKIMRALGKILMRKEPI